MNFQQRITGTVAEIRLGSAYGDILPKSYTRWTVTTNIHGEVFIVLADCCIYQLHLGRLKQTADLLKGDHGLLNEPRLDLYAGVRQIVGHPRRAHDGARIGEAIFEMPSCIDASADEKGRIWVADETANRIRVVVGDRVQTAAGASDPKFMNNGDGLAMDLQAAIVAKNVGEPADGDALGGATFKRPNSLLYIHQSKKILVTERGRSSIRIFDLKTSKISTIKIKFQYDCDASDIRLSSSQLHYAPNAPVVVRITDHYKYSSFHLFYHRTSLLTDGSLQCEALRIDKNLLPIANFTQGGVPMTYWTGKGANWIQWDVGLSTFAYMAGPGSDPLEGAVQWTGPAPKHDWYHFLPQYNVLVGYSSVNKSFTLVPNHRSTPPDPFHASGGQSPTSSLSDLSGASSSSHDGQSRLPPTPAVSHHPSPLPSSSSSYAAGNGAGGARSALSPLPQTPGNNGFNRASPTHARSQSPSAQAVVGVATPSSSSYAIVPPPSSNRGGNPFALPPSPGSLSEMSHSPTHTMNDFAPPPGVVLHPLGLSSSAAVPTSSNGLTGSNGSSSYSSLSIDPPMTRSSSSSDFGVRRIERVDLSPILDLAIPGDLEITHAYSGRHWKLHSEVLNMHPDMDVDRLMRTVSGTFLPVESVEALILYLYCKPLANPKDLQTSCHLASHVVRFWIDLGLSNLEYLLYEFSTTVVSQMTESVACTSLLEMWSDKHIEWTLADHVFQILASYVRQHCIDHFNLRASESDIPNKRLVPLISHMSSSAPLYYCIQPLYAPSLPERKVSWRKTAPPKGSSSSPTHSSASFNSTSPTPTDLPIADTPEQLIQHESDYVFGFQADSEYCDWWLVAPAVYLWAQWSFFRRMLSSTMQEASSRVIRMPTWMTANLLLAMLNPIHRIPESVPYLLLDTEALALLEHAREFDLVDDLGKPLGCFIPLLQQCYESIFPPLSESNVLTHFSKYYRLNMDKQMNDVASLIIRHSFENIMSRVAMELDDELIINLVSRIRRIQQKKLQNASTSSL